MRHRRVISLYDEDQAHRELLIHLESITGQTRQAQALLQMCLVGFRVMVFQEGGEQAFLSVRNPDLLLRAGKRKSIPRLPASQERPAQTYEQEPERSPMVPMADPEPAEVLSSSKVDLPQVPQESVREVSEPLVVEKEPEPQAGDVGEDVESEDFAVDEEYDTLKMLQLRGGQ